MNGRAVCLSRRRCPRRVDAVLCPETCVTRVVSSGWPDLNLETEIADAIGELGYGADRIAAGEMIGAKVLVASIFSQHVVGSGQARGRDGDSSFLRAATCL
jgi:hypothetical protein